MDYTIAQIKDKLKANRQWAERALVVLLARQTADEQASESTQWQNGQGFNGPDANILTSFAKQVQQGRQLSTKQAAIAFRLLPKYAGQLHRIAQQKGDSNV